MNSAIQTTIATRKGIPAEYWFPPSPFFNNGDMYFSFDYNFSQSATVSVIFSPEGVVTGVYADNFVDNLFNGVIE